MIKLYRTFILIISLLLSGYSYATELRGTGDLGLVIERADGSVLILDHSKQTVLHRVTGLGDLSHASAVYSRDARYAYIFGRDGGLSKIDILTGTLVKRIIQSGNSIGGAISQDGQYVAVSNYTPGGVNIFSAETLEPVLSLPSESKTVGLVDAPRHQFIVSLFDKGEIWQIDLTDVKSPNVTKYTEIGKKPYDALMSANGRYYIAGLFGEDGLALLDLWQDKPTVSKILPSYGKGEKKLPVYKMPHLEGWALAGDYAFVPAVGQHAVLVIDTKTWKEVKRIPVHGQPVFVMAQPDERQVWVNFAIPNNDTIQVIDVPKLDIKREMKVGKAVLHMEFTPRGEHVWLSVRDEDQLAIYDTHTLKELKRLPAKKPSGIFFTSRAHRIGL